MYTEIQEWNNKLIRELRKKTFLESTGFILVILHPT